MRRDTWIQIGAVGVFLVCLTLSGVLTTQVSASSGRNRLVYADAVEEDAAEEEALGIALGAFRGLFVNYLWIRANTLKEEGKYYEAVDLAKTITKLQPRFPRVWAFHAWNLAYNISVTTHTQRERWNWVRSGIDLLRNEGIPSNPSDTLLHKELAWLFLHKVQGIMDDAHWYYKKQHAIEWTAVMGTPPKRRGDLTSRDAYIEALAGRLQGIVDAPDTIEELYEAEPKAEELVLRLRNDAGLDIREYGGRYALLLNFEALRSQLEAFRAIEEAMPGHETGIGIQLPEGDALGALLTDPEYARSAGPALIRHVRKRMLEDDYHMEPARMLRYTRKYGPLDWRHPAAHALYWSARGVEQGLMRATAENERDFDFVNTDRLVIQSVQELFRSGELFFNLANPDTMQLLPNTDYIETYGEILDELSARSEFDTREGGYGEQRVWRFYASGYENFLQDAIRMLFRRGERERAYHYFEKLAEYEGQNLNDPFRAEKFQVTLEEFVVNEILGPSAMDDRLTSNYVAREEIQGSIQQAFLQGLLQDNQRLYDEHMEYARKFHKIYVDRQVFNTAVNQGERARLEVVKEDFDEEAGIQLARMIDVLGFPDGPVIYRRAPQPIRTWAYRLMQRSPMYAQMQAMAEQQQTIGFDDWFPPTPQNIADSQAPPPDQRQPVRDGIEIQ